MNAEVFAEWLRRQGHRVVRTASSYWYDQGPRVYQAFPYHWLISPSEDELHAFLVGNRVIGLRYSTAVDSHEGVVSYHAVYEEPQYGFSSLGKWARKNVRRGLRNCEVAPISFDRLAEEGWVLQVDTLARQGRRLKLDRETWCHRCQSASDLAGFDAWGALVGGNLAGSVITFQMDDCCYMLYQQCHRDYLVHHVSNALSFVVTQEVVGRSGIRSVLYGLHSIDAPASVDEFKFRMGYRAKPVRQRVRFNPRVRWCFNAATHAALRGLVRLRPGSPGLAKAEGMVRFYLQGRLPPEKQRWPEPLSERRAELLAQLLSGAA